MIAAVITVVLFLVILVAIIISLARGGGGGSSGGLNLTTQEEKDQFLERHNVRRCMHGSPALKWDNALYLNTEKTFAGATSMQHSASYDLTADEGGPSGENLFWGTGGGWTPTEIVDAWYSEVDNCIWPGCMESKGG